MLPLSDLLFALPVKFGLVSIPDRTFSTPETGSIRWLPSATHSSFGLCGLAYSELKGEGAAARSTPFDFLNREGALCWSDSFFEVKHFQYTLLATLADREPTSHELFGFDQAAGISDQSAEIIAPSAQSFGPENDTTVFPVARIGAVRVAFLPGMIEGASIVLLREFEARAALDMLERSGCAYTFSLPAVAIARFMQVRVGG